MWVKEHYKNSHLRIGGEINKKKSLCFFQETVLAENNFWALLGEGSWVLILFSDLVTHVFKEPSHTFQLWEIF